MEIGLCSRHSLALLLALSCPLLDAAQGRFSRGNRTQHVLDPLNRTTLHTLAKAVPSNVDDVGHRIGRMLVKTCVRLKKRWGSKFESHGDCVEWMRKICNPGKDMKMNGEHFETPSGDGFCQAYFGIPVADHVEDCIALAKKGEQHMSFDEHHEYTSCKDLMMGLCKTHTIGSHRNDEKRMDHEELKKGKYCERFFRTTTTQTTTIATGHSSVSERNSTSNIILLGMAGCSICFLVCLVLFILTPEAEPTPSYDNTPEG
mmetsp:Transcript_36960/g.73144  ORF Transcript_36960/g.73144 Transcript_36960/m.73144 type:complete len:259 (+) Transcript_36960:27-803(+)